jgi:hypothetical protein
MATWQEFWDDAPELAEEVRARLVATKHHVLATLRRDGSPRVSGTEIDFVGEDLILGSMWQAVKAKDLRRDGRYALHANPGDGSMEGGDAKLAGVAVEVPAPSGQGSNDPAALSHRFRLLLAEVVLTRVHPDGDRLAIQIWRPGAGVMVVERR